MLILLVPTPTPPPAAATVTIPLLESVVTVTFAPAEMSVAIPVSPPPDPTNSAAVTLPPTVILVPLNPITFVPALLLMPGTSILFPNLTIPLLLKIVNASILSGDRYFPLPDLSLSPVIIPTQFTS